MLQLLEVYNQTTEEENILRVLWSRIASENLTRPRELYHKLYQQWWTEK